jgi:hypothetical protein
MTGTWCNHFPHHTYVRAGSLDRSCRQLLLIPSSPTAASLAQPFAVYFTRCHAIEDSLGHCGHCSLFGSGCVQSGMNDTVDDQHAVRTSLKKAKQKHLSPFHI